VKKCVLALVLVTASTAWGQVVTHNEDILGVHNLGSASSPVSGLNSGACLYCHAPHSAASKGPLWGQGFSSQSYSLYTSDTLQNAGQQPEIGKDSSLCLSCHDGTIAPGRVGASGPLQVSGHMTSIFGAQLESSHPFSLQLPIKDASNLVPSLVAQKTTADPTGAVKLIGDNIECTTCHNGHNQFIDPDQTSFLVRDNHNGALCLACHSTSSRIVNSRNNPLEQWTTGIHATSTAQVSSSAGLGGYNTMAEFACQSCHVSHNAGAPAGLLRKPSVAMTGVDNTSQSCYVCHGDSNTLVQPTLNVLAEFQKIGHPYATDINVHTAGETVVLNQNRHTTCADCHNAHAAKDVLTFGAAPDIRGSQLGASGAGIDGSALTNPATRQYETCLRCHGTSTGKDSPAAYGYLPARLATSADPLNVIPEFDSTAGSAHPVMRTATGGLQPSLLKQMWDLTGTVPGRAMGTQIFCSDCHNSDDNREFGGQGPNGPHGSIYPHILERRYEMSEVAAGVFPAGGPGSLITNLFPTPLLTPSGNGPYALCAKCHDLTNVNSNATFANHSDHIQLGISCSVCHSAHGVPGATASVMSDGSRLVNFDLKVVAPYDSTTPITWRNGSCALTCHMAAHDGQGNVTKLN
jgi:hypothetical protein